jgi:outer membrane protein OmpA-like peptidoglycan-associated protein
MILTTNLKMKKTILCMFMLMTVVLGVNAQVIEKQVLARQTQSNIFDNVYVGLNVGAGYKTVDGGAFWKNLNTTAGVRVGKWITPIWGVAVDGEAYFDNNPHPSTGTFIKASNISMLSTMNLTNLINGYDGEPKMFEIIPIAGLGWGHVYGDRIPSVKSNYLTTKFGIDFAFDLGKKKAWQVYVEPAIVYALNSSDKVQFNVNHSALRLSAGVIYKFKTSNKGHNFKLYDITAYENTIAQLKDELARKPQVVEKIIQVPMPVTAAVEKDNQENTWIVRFAFDSSELTNDAKTILDGIGQNAIVDIVAEATNEGSKNYNKKLSQKRADVVKNYLENRGLRVNSAVGVGASKTGSRIAVVKIK